jgi:hypothetical protein
MGFTKLTAQEKTAFMQNYYAFDAGTRAVPLNSNVQMQVFLRVKFLPLFLAWYYF